ncbi:MAG: ABC transporter permease [bacterium]
MKPELFIAQRYLKAERKGLFAMITTVIGVAGVAIGVAALITTLSVMNGFQSDIQKKVIGAQAHITVYGRLSSDNISALRKRISSDPDLEASAPFVLGQGIITRNGRSLGVVVKGIDPDLEFKVNTLESSMESGGWTTLKKKTDRHAIILGEELARSIGAWTGDDIVLIAPSAATAIAGIIPKMRRFKVEGTVRTGYYEFDNTMAWCRLEEASEFFGLEGGASGIGLKLKNLETAPRTAKRLKSQLGFPFAVRTYAEMNRTLFAALHLEKFVMSVILILIVIVASFNIASNLILLGTEKLRDVGLLRAMGAEPAFIRRIFWWEGALIGGTGMLAGTALGLALSWIIGHYPVVELPSDIYYLSRVPVDVRWTDVLAVMAGSWLICMLAAVYPALRSSRINPADAIRYG